MGKAKAWRKWEIDLLTSEYHYRSAEDLAKEFGRTVNAVLLKASRLNLKKPFQVDNPKDLEFLKCYGKDFEERCIDKCPAWYECLGVYSNQVKKELQLEYKLHKITVTGSTTAEAIIQAIREANKK